MPDRLSADTPQMKRLRAALARAFADFDRSDACVIGGTIATSFGLAMVFTPLGLIFAGLVALFVGLLPTLVQLLRRAA